jgi:hypothetical protein
MSSGTPGGSCESQLNKQYSVFSSSFGHN